MSHSSNRRSYASNEPALAAHLPDALKNQAGVRHSFDHARDPLISQQLQDLDKTEHQRREEQGDGSQMVKLHKPFPELKPKHHQSVMRSQFNQSWIKEQRSARMAQYQQEMDNKPEAPHEPQPHQLER